MKKITKWVANTIIWSHGFKDFFTKYFIIVFMKREVLKCLKRQMGINFAKNILFMFIQYDHLLLGIQTIQALIFKCVKLLTKWQFLPILIKILLLLVYRKFTSSNTSRLEAHAGFFRLLMKWIFNPYVPWLFDKKLLS